MEDSTMCGYPVTWINRDFIGSAVKPDRIDQVILLCNGWWMHKKGTYQFITPDWIVPIYTSVHFVDPQMITAEVATHLKRFQPIGCRDLASVTLLQQNGIEAYFSGCLTMVLNMRDPAYGYTQTEDYSQNEIQVDTLNRFNLVPIAPLIKRTQHHKEPGYLPNLARILQDMYNYMFAQQIVTPRLHVWLPLACNGAPVILMSKHTNVAFKVGDKDNESEAINRFGGLTDIALEPKLLPIFTKGLLTDTLEKIQHAL